MGLKDKMLWAVIGMLLMSLVGNLFLLKYKVEINLISGSSNSRESEKSSASKIFSNIISKDNSGSDFYNDFEDGSPGGWKGKITKEIIPQGSKYALDVSKANNPYFATATSKTFEKKELRVGNNTHIEFDYFIKDASVLRIQMYCPKRRDNFYFDIENPVLGEWKKLSVGFSAFEDNSHTGLVPQRGDEFSSVQIYGGKAGEDTTLIIDNFQIVEGE